MLRILWILPLVLVVACASAPPEDNKLKKAELHLQLGTSQLSQGNYPSALAELLEAEKLNPNNPVIQNNLGLAYFVRQKYAIAEKHIQRAIELEPKYTEARNNLGRTLIELGQYDRAIEMLKIAAEDLTYAFPEKSLSNLGVAYFKRGDYAQARVHLRKSLDIRRNSCLTLNYYGRSLYELKEFDRAADVLDMAIPQCKPQGFDEPHFFAGLSYFSKGDLERAATRFEETIHGYPNGNYTKKASNMLKTLKRE